MASNTQTTDDNLKELKLRIAKNSMHKEFYFENGGQVPAALGGIYTDEFSAEMAKNLYLDTRPKKTLAKPKTPVTHERTYSGKPSKVK